MTAEIILQALSRIRAPKTQDEYDLHGMVAQVLQETEIPFQHEASLAPRCRIDFLCGRVGVEIKRGKMDMKAVARQLNRYAATGKVDSLILVAEKTQGVPAYAEKIPVYPVSLNKLWGLSVEAATDIGIDDFTHLKMEKMFTSEVENAISPGNVFTEAVDDMALSHIVDENVPCKA